MKEIRNKKNGGYILGIALLAGIAAIGGGAFLLLNNNNTSEEESPNIKTDGAVILDNNTLEGAKDDGSIFDRIFGNDLENENGGVSDGENKQDGGSDLNNESGSSSIEIEGPSLPTRERSLSEENCPAQEIWDEERGRCITPFEANRGLNSLKSFIPTSLATKDVPSPDASQGDLGGTSGFVGGTGFTGSGLGNTNNRSGSLKGDFNITDYGFSSEDKKNADFLSEIRGLAITMGVCVGSGYLISLLPISVGTLDGASIAKECGLDPVANTLKNRLIQKLSDQYINWASNGFQGRPSVIDRPDLFVRDFVGEEVRGLIGNSGLGFLCSPTGNLIDIRLRLKQNFNERYRRYRGSEYCTAEELLTGIEELDENLVNFSVGGGGSNSISANSNFRQGPIGSNLTFNRKLDFDEYVERSIKDLKRINEPTLAEQAIATEVAIAEAEANARETSDKIIYGKNVGVVEREEDGGFRQVASGEEIKKQGEAIDKAKLDNITQSDEFSEILQDLASATISGLLKKAFGQDDSRTRITKTSVKSNSGDTGSETSGNSADCSNGTKTARIVCDFTEGKMAENITALVRVSQSLEDTIGILSLLPYTEKISFFENSIHPSSQGGHVASTVGYKSLKPKFSNFVLPDKEFLEIYGAPNQILTLSKGFLNSLVEFKNILLAEDKEPVLIPIELGKEIKNNARALLGSVSAKKRQIDPYFNIYISTIRANEAIVGKTSAQDTSQGYKKSNYPKGCAAIYTLPAQYFHKKRCQILELPEYQGISSAARDIVDLELRNEFGKGVLNTYTESEDEAQAVGCALTGNRVGHYLQTKCNINTLKIKTENAIRSTVPYVSKTEDLISVMFELQLISETFKIYKKWRDSSGEARYGSDLVDRPFIYIPKEKPQNLFLSGAGASGDKEKLAETKREMVSILSRVLGDRANVAFPTDNIVFGDLRPSQAANMYTRNFNKKVLNKIQGEVLSKILGNN